MKNQLSRITIDIPSHLHKKFKANAAEQGKSMRELILEYIMSYTEECSFSHTPNITTTQSLTNSKKKQNIVRCEDFDDLMNKLGM